MGTGNIFVYKGGMPPQGSPDTRVHQHITAARAFHTDLIAETHRRLRLLTNLAHHLHILRSRDSTLTERLTAAESSRADLERLEESRHASLPIHRDFRRAMRRIHGHLRRMATSERAATARSSSRATLKSGRG